VPSVSSFTLTGRAEQGQDLLWAVPTHVGSSEAGMLKADIFIRELEAGANISGVAVEGEAFSPRSQDIPLAQVAFVSEKSACEEASATLERAVPHLARAA